MSVKILIADDHPSIIDGLASLLPLYNISVVAKATAVDEISALYAESKPDVAVLDVRFGDKKTGLEVAKGLISKFGAKIIFYSQFDQDEEIQEMYRIGGKGLVTKNKQVSVLADAIQSAVAGKVFFLPEIAERIALLSLHGDSNTNPMELLDDREKTVFLMLASGKTNTEIADELNLSLKTISITSNSVKEKLGVQRPAEITRLAVKMKLIEP